MRWNKHVMRHWMARVAFCAALGTVVLAIVSILFAVARLII